MRVRNIIITACIVAVIIIAVVLVLSKKAQSSPPGLIVTNGTETAEAVIGTYSWGTGTVTSGSHVSSDSIGPLALYKRGSLNGIKPAEDGSVSLKFEKNPKSVAVVIYPESAAETENYGSMIHRDAAGPASGYMFSVPTDGIYIVHVYTSWSRGECYYCFYTKP